MSPASSADTPSPKSAGPDAEDAPRRDDAVDPATDSESADAAQAPDAKESSDTESVTESDTGTDIDTDTAAATASPDAPRCAALIYNPTKVNARTLHASVQRHSADNGWSEPLLFETTPDDLGDGVTREALASGVNVVLVAGGDGTVRAVSEAMSGSGVPLAIIPSGTGNLLARNLRLPLDHSDAMVRAAFTGDQVAMDIGFTLLKRQDGVVDEHAFVVMGGIGLDAAMIANTNPNLKKTVGWVAYVDGAARSLANAKPFSVMYQLPGHKLHSVQVQSVLFANCGKLPAGLDLIPEASITDGKLDIAIFKPKGPFGWMMVWRRVAWDNSVLRRFRTGRHILNLRTKDSSVTYSHGEGIEIGTSDPQPVQLDGDEFGTAVHVTTRVEAGALLLAVPHGHRIPGM